ncbi:hypothetical protein IAT38_001028 [Cryptococcus sp. DSM 104549]
MDSLFSPAPHPPSPTAPTTDFALIELEKENIRPLATGRSAATLSSVFKQPSEADKLLQAGHEKHRANIEEAERRDTAGEDMADGVQDILAVYNAYVSFTVQHHPSSDFHLLPLLETTTRRFVNDGRFSQDVRYLKLWVMYARQIERREEIWAFLESRDIGTKNAEFYEEWASALEGLGRRKKADEIYRIGIARKASPLERLKLRHKAFLERIMAPPSGVVPDDDPLPPSSSSSSAPSRTPRPILGQVSNPLHSLSGATQLAPSLRQASGPGNGARMEVFVDTEQRGDVPAGEWAEFGSRDGRRKENTVEAVPWKGETLPQSAARVRVAPRTPKPEVFQDSTDSNEPRSQVISDPDVFSRHRQPPTEAEMLKSNPLRHYDTSGLSTAVPSLPAPPSARKPLRSTKTPAAAPAPPSVPAPTTSAPAQTGRYIMQPWAPPTDGPEVKLANGKVERRMFKWDAVYKDGEEWSEREIRAKKMGLWGKEWRGKVQAWEREWHKPGSTTPPPPKAKEDQKRPPSPTVNTKLAEAEVMRMFDQTIHGGKTRHASDSDSDSDSESSDDGEGDVGVAPTPLPNRGGRGQVAMLAPTPGGAVPPTPTPGGFGGGRLFTVAEGGVDSGAAAPRGMAVFNDENASAPGPTPARTPAGKMAIFSDENAQPAPAPAPTPAGKMAIFSDENAQPAPAPAPTPAGKMAIFSDENAQPAPAPTPAGSKMTIFSDENAVPPASAKKFNIFSETPAKTPLAAREPVAASASKGFGVFADENQTPARPAPAAPAPAAASVFATPALGRGAPLRRGVTEVIQEVAEDEEDEDEAPAPAQGQVIHPPYDFAQTAEADEAYDEEEEEEDQPRGMRRFNINMMTPITERTCEYTQTTQWRSSRRGSGVVGVEEGEEAEEAEEGEGDQAFVGSSVGGASLRGSTSAHPAPAPAPTSSLNAVSEESGGQSANTSLAAPEFDDSALLASGDVEQGFVLPDGFTIHRREAGGEGEGAGEGLTDGLRTMVLVDGSRVEDGAKGKEEQEQGQGHTETMGTGQDKSVYLTAAYTDEPPSALPNPCNPANPEILSTLLSSIDPPLSSLPGFIDSRPAAAHKLDALQKHARSKVRRASTSSRSSAAAGSADDVCSLELAGRACEVRDKIGEGGFGAVFLAVDVAVRQAQDEADSDDEDEDVPADKSLVALKVESPGSCWEAVVLDRIAGRISPALRPSIVRARNLYLFQDESFLALDYSAQGTLLDIVNKANAIWGTPQVDELVAAFFTVELLKLVEGLHGAGFIHGDLKIDNCLVRVEDLPNSAWAAGYTRSGSDGWAAQGVRLIDFGRAIDLSLFPAGKAQRFIVDWKTDERDCKEMREGRAWSYETDYFGMAGVAYCLLFGRYMKTEVVDGKVKIDQPMKRYWQAPLWTALFDTLLNPGDPASLPITSRLTEVRGQFEGWLEENCQKGGKSLKSMLRKIELAATTARRG